MDQKKPEPADEEYERAAANRQKVGIGCLVVLGGPFLVFGLFLLFSGLFGASESGKFVQLIKLVAGGGIVFGFAALMYKQLNNRKSIEAALRVKHQHPKEPWMWREDWAAGENWDFAPQRLIRLWVPVAGLVIIALAIPYFKQSVGLGHYFETYPFLIYVLVAATLFPAALAARRALSETARIEKFGRAKFQMSQVPAQLGGRLCGCVETTMQKIPPDGVSVRFENVALGAGFKNHKEEQIVSVHCSTDITISSEELSQGPAGVTVPIDLPISADGLPYGNTSSGGDSKPIRYRWRLIVTARLPGVDYRAEFQPPVFDLGEDGLVKGDFQDIAV